MKYIQCMKAGYRKISNALHNEMGGKIVLLGPCTMFGNYVSNDETIAYYLQELTADNSKNYEVLNCSNAEVEENLFRPFSEKIVEDDIECILQSIVRSVMMVSKVQ